MSYFFYLYPYLKFTPETFVLSKQKVGEHYEHITYFRSDCPLINQKSLILNTPVPFKKNIIKLGVFFINGGTGQGALISNLKE